MSVSFPLLLVFGTAGGLLFQNFKIPGGAMVGAMLGSLLCNILLTSEFAVVLPSSFKTVSYILMGIVVGSMFRPDMMDLIRQCWHMLLLSSLILIGGGVISAYLTYRTGTLSATSAYLATSPGGLNALSGLAAQMGEDAPIILLFQMVRMYAVILTAPVISRFFLH